MPRMTRALAARQTGTSAPTASAAAARRGSSSAMPLARASRRSAAAASDEPPPIPAATGSFFSRWKAPPVRPGTRAPSAAAALSTRLSAVAPQTPPNGPGDGERRLSRGRERQRVANVGEGDQALELMIAVGATADDAQRQVDLGGGEVGGDSVHAQRFTIRSSPRQRGLRSRCDEAIQRWMPACAGMNGGWGAISRRCRPSSPAPCRPATRSRPAGRSSACRGSSADPPDRA